MEIVVHSLESGANKGMPNVVYIQGPRLPCKPSWGKQASDSTGAWRKSTQGGHHFKEMCTGAGVFGVILRQAMP